MKLKDFFVLMLTVLFLLILVSFIYYHLFGLVEKVYKEKKENAKLKNEVQELKQRQDEIKKGIRVLSDPNFIEKEARVKLNFKKEGENVIYFVNPEKNSAQKTDKSNKIENHYGNKIKENIKKWLDVIFD